jgi:rare lipoprotein A (peptidoglycan hydrolase)
MHAPIQAITNLTSATTRRRALLAVVATLVALAILLTATSAAQARRATHVSWAPELNRKIVPTRSEGHGMQVATWYGPGFYGNGTACGQTLKEGTWGIAHRTLPCGTLVTLSHKGRKVTVRVIDRGPYSGATVDLTSRTKKYLRFTSGQVRMSEVKKFRVLPKPNKRVVGSFAARH